MLQGGDRRSEEVSIRHAVLKNKIEERFPWLVQQARSEYMRIARASVENSGEFNKWLTGGRNWKKALVLTSHFEQADLKALDEGETAGGLTLDEFDAMTFKEVKEYCRRFKKQKEVGMKQLSDLQGKLIKAEHPDKETDEEFEKRLRNLATHFDVFLLGLEPKMVEMLELGSKGGWDMKKRIALVGAAKFMRMRMNVIATHIEECYGNAEMFREDFEFPKMGIDALIEEENK